MLQYSKFMHPIPLPAGETPQRMALVNPESISHRGLGSPFGAGDRVGIEDWIERGYSIRALFFHKLTTVLLELYSLRVLLIKQGKPVIPGFPICVNSQSPPLRCMNRDQASGSGSEVK
jgi:hypothetical protein